MNFGCFVTSVLVLLLRIREVVCVIADHSIDCIIITLASTNGFARIPLGSKVDTFETDVSLKSAHTLFCIPNFIIIRSVVLA